MVTTKVFRPAPLNLRVNTFIKKVIRHARLLINAEKSDINKMTALSIIEALENNNNRVNFTERGAARFFLANLENIRFLIKNDDQEKLAVFNEIKDKSEIYQYL